LGRRWTPALSHLCGEGSRSGVAPQVAGHLHNGKALDQSKLETDFGVYAENWLERLNLRASTEELYRSMYRTHIEPTFADVPFKHLDTEQVRAWHSRLKRKKQAKTQRTLSLSTVAKVYRLMRQICEHALDDGYLPANPCRIEKAGVEKVPERLYNEPPTPQQIRTLADAVPSRYRALVLLAGFGGLRWGELAGLQRHHVNLAERTARVEQQLSDVNGSRAITEPKTEAGVRTLHLHTELVGALRSHLTHYVGSGPEAFVFTSETGEWLRASNFRRRVWHPATTAVGCPGLRFHDLRHAAATLATDTGVPLKDVMARMGHSSERAALRYQHARQDKQRAIADALDTLLAPDENVVPLRRKEDSA
jgi:integrase